MSHGSGSGHYTLSRRQRDAFAFSETSSRRQLIPTYQSSLANIDFRMRSCQTCGKQFSNAGELTKHVALNHTGSKPISCNVCGKRFGSSRQMKSHYQQHREPRLEEFGYLRTPRQARDLVSETTSSSETTVGSFHRIPKGLKTYVSENSPTAKDTFGTEQSFHPYVPNTHKLKLLRDMYEDPDHPRLQTVDTKLPDIRSTNGKTVVTNGKEGEKTKSIPDADVTRVKSKFSLPQLDAGNISVIDTVMGASRVTDTSKKSHFLEKAQDDFINARMSEVSLAGRSPTPKSFRSFSGTVEYRKPKYLINREFWDTGSRATGSAIRYSPVSGYDPYNRDNGSVKSWQGTQALSHRR